MHHGMMDDRAGTHLVRGQVAALAEDGAREGLVERIRVRVRVGAHRLDERLARASALGAVVDAVVRVEYARLRGGAFESPRDNDRCNKS